MENVNGVVCLSFLCNKNNTYIFYNSDNDIIETFIYFSLMEDKTIMDQKFINFFVGSHKYELRYLSCTYNKHNIFSVKIVLVGMGKVFQIGGINIILIK